MIAEILSSLPEKIGCAGIYRDILVIIEKLEQFFFSVNELLPNCSEVELRIVFCHLQCRDLEVAC